MTVQEILDGVLPEYKEDKWHSISFAIYTQITYEAEQITKSLLDNNADPIKLREIYLKIAQTEEAKYSIINLINAIKKLHDMAIDYLDNRNNRKPNWIGVNYERTE